ncbi:MAG: PP2C family protein-serine/threonine phosphatase [Lachnospiraceae bacterium]|nr:PP2C family protein-serine/threonine phosphatase [Lachnospiraceae bacterium]
MITIALWSFAVLMASVFGAMLSMITLKEKYSKKTMTVLWILAAAAGYVVAFVSYYVNLTDDTVGILGLTALVVLFVLLFYEGTISEKLFVSLTACLIDNVCTFMFCGTTDTLLGRRLGLIIVSPYDTPNLLFFIGIKLIVYVVFFFLYRRFLRKPLQDMIKSLEGNLTSFVAAPAVSVLGFYVINLFTNRNDIYPDNPWFFPLYLTVCLIFVIEFWLLYYSVLQSSKAMKSAAELGVAANIQKSMLPCIFPPFPDREEVDIYATMDPAKEVGGDFYDFFMVDDSHLAIVMADVSGKGVPAALFMVIGKTLIKDHTRPDRDLGEVFTEVNNLLCESNSEGMFITAFEGVLDLETGEFRFVNAGHEMPFIQKSEEEFQPYRIKPGFVLAGMEGIKYRAGSMRLDVGDKIFQYTDGVTEATNAENKLYGMERLEKVLNQCREKDVTEILSVVKKDIDLFVGNAPQFDDITMLCLEFKSKMIREEKSDERADH